MGRRNRILLTSEYLGPIKSCLVGAAIGFICSISWYAVVAAISPQGSYLTFGNYVLIAAIGVLFLLIGSIVGWSVWRFRFDSVKGAALAALLWPALTYMLPLVWMFAWSLFLRLQHTSDLDGYNLVPVVLLSWLYLIPLVIFFLPAAVLSGALVPWTIVRLSWWSADKMR